MGNIRRLSVNDLRRVAGVSDKQYKKIDWHGSQLIMKRLLTVQEYVELIHHILDDCRSKEKDVFAIELLEFSIRLNTISAYAFVELPTEIDEIYYIVYSTDLYDVVCKNANRAQVESIRKSVMLYVGGDD